MTNGPGAISPLTAEEAQSALRDIERTENRSIASRHGKYTAPHLIMWGVVWVVGYLVCAIEPRWSWIWAALVLVGVGASFVIDRQLNREAIKGYNWRYGLSFAAIFIFIFALFAIMRPHEDNQIAAFYPLVIGLYYTFIGIWTKGWRMLPLGVALMALTLVGYWFLPDYFLYWMAAVGGGGLILGGLWLRSA